MSLRSAILGFLSIEPTTGYSLRQRFEGSVGAFWTVTQSQIYRELHALEAAGLVRSTREAGDGKPDRKVYALSAEGRDALATWLREPLEPLQLRHPLLLKFVFSAEVPAVALDEQLEHYRSSLERSRTDYVARLSAREIFALARSKREATLWRLSIEHGIAWCDAELAWIGHAREALGRRSRRSR